MQKKKKKNKSRDAPLSVSPREVMYGGMAYNWLTGQRARSATSHLDKRPFPLAKLSFALVLADSWGLAGKARRVSDVENYETVEFGAMTLGIFVPRTAEPHQTDGKRGGGHLGSNLGVDYYAVVISSHV